MRKILNTCLILTLALPLGAMAMSSQSVSSAQSFTGGIIVSGRAAVSGSSDASANIHSVVGGRESGTTRVDIRTNINGVDVVSSRETIRQGGRVEAVVATSSKNSSAFVKVSAHPLATTSAPSQPSEPTAPRFGGVFATTSPHTGPQSALLGLFKSLFSFFAFFK